MDLCVLTAVPKAMVAIAPPINPSHVFLGDSLIRGVLPKKNPNIYAIMSLHMIIETGTRNLKRKEYTYSDIP